MKKSNKASVVAALLLTGVVNSGLAQMPAAIDTRTDEFDALMGFEVATGDVLPNEWGGNRTFEGVTVALDREVFRSGRASARIRQTGASSVSLQTIIPVDFEGTNIELRGYLRSEDVTSIFGSGNPLEGTHDWTEFRVSAQLDPDAHTLSFGVLAIGLQGTIWVDDLELLVDGVPPSELPRIDTLTDQRRTALIARAESAGPASVASDATIKTLYGGEYRTLREGSNDWTCWAELPGLEPMCNDPAWEAWLAAYMNRDESFEVEEFGVSYMLAGEGEAPHVMLLLPGLEMFDGLSMSGNAPVFVMNMFAMDGEYPFAHVMLKVADEPLQENPAGGIQQLILPPQP